MKIVSVMTGAAPGGAEFAAVELLDALIDRGHEAVMVSDSPEIGRETAVKVRHLELGPKLSGSTWPSLALKWPALRTGLRQALEAEAPYDVLLLHYKKEQLLAPGLPPALRPRVAWCEWGPVPRQMRQGPGRWAYARAGRGVTAVMAISEGTRESVIAAGVAAEKVTYLPNAMRTEEIRFSAEGRSRVRAELGIPTVFNVLGPLAHPARLTRQVVGAADDGLAARMAAVLQNRGAELAWVVAGADAIDELGLTGTSVVYEVRPGRIDRFDFAPEDVGLKRISSLAEIAGGDAGRNVDLFRAILSGSDQGPRRDVVVLNAAAGLVVAGLA
ncbi:MAG TPA: glycosyltransferase, partial [Solirubrobacterales bacterium]